MSVHHLSAVADLSDVPPTCKLVLYALAIDASSAGAVIVNHEQLRQRTGLSERAIRGTLKTLATLGLIERGPLLHRLTIRS